VMVAQGAKLAVIGAGPQGLRDLAQELDALAIAADLTAPAGVAGAMAEIEEALGGIDLLLAPCALAAGLQAGALRLMRRGGV
ncbi:SDR family oxidoreductase, partial [Klebsiella pneumoniae]|nr:SDR family oxidoreductase [Klebsiella pneumoniae]